MNIFSFLSENFTHIFFQSFDRFWNEERRFLVQDDGGSGDKVEKLILPQFYSSLIGLVCVDVVAAIVCLWEWFSTYKKEKHCYKLKNYLSRTK